MTGSRKREKSKYVMKKRKWEILPVKKSCLFICVCAFLLFQASCEESSKNKPVYQPPEIPPSRTLTLSQEQLVFLDWHSPHRRGTRVEGKRIVAGAGVEFDIYFPPDIVGGCPLNFVSSGEGARGHLTGADIRGYESFALKFSLVSINGESQADMKQKLAVGAVIGPNATGQLSSYEPFTLGMGNEDKSVRAETPVHTDKIYQIGFHVHKLNPQEWAPRGVIVTILVEPAEEAGPVLVNNLFEILN